MFFAGDQQKQLRCQKIRQNRIRRDVRTRSSSSGGPSTSVDSSDLASLSPKSQKTSSPSANVDVGHQELQPGEQTHVIASAVDRSMLQSLSSWCTERLEEVCIKNLDLFLSYKT